MKDMQHHSPWWKPRWFVLLVCSTPHLIVFAAEPETDGSDSEDGYLDEDVGDLDELGSDIEIHPDDLDAASTDGEYVLPLFPILYTDLIALCSSVALKNSTIPLKLRLAKNDLVRTRWTRMRTRTKPSRLRSPSHKRRS